MVIRRGIVVIDNLGTWRIRTGAGIDMIRLLGASYPTGLGNFSRVKGENEWLVMNDIAPLIRECHRRGIEAQYDPTIRPQHARVRPQSAQPSQLKLW